MKRLVIASFVWMLWLPGCGGRKGTKWKFKQWQNNAAKVIQPIESLIY